MQPSVGFSDEERMIIQRIVNILKITLRKRNLKYIRIFFRKTFCKSKDHRKNFLLKYIPPLVLSLSPLVFEVQRDTINFLKDNFYENFQTARNIFMNYEIQKFLRMPNALV